MKRRSLAKKSEFHEVYERGAKKVGRLLVVYLLDGPDQAQAVVASRKIGNAVRRNRAKRLLREALRRSVLGRPEGTRVILTRFFPVSVGENSTPDQSRGLWVVLVARSAILDAGAQDVSAELDHLLGSP